MNKLKKTFCIILFLIVTNCGYKLIDKSKLNQFYISDIQSQGDKKINYFIRSKLNTIFSNQVSGQKLKITLQTSKNKNVKEKNIKNQITKYEINIVSEVEVYFLDKNLSEKFILELNEAYRVATIHSNTIDNQNNLERRLADRLSDKIIKKITFIINDF